MAISAISVQRYFARLRDPRLNRRKRHLLIDIIVIALCGVICGALYGALGEVCGIFVSFMRASTAGASDAGAASRRSA